jgi:hypothetical protein
MALSPSNGPISVFGSQALTVKPPALNRQNSEHYRGVPPILARWRSSQRSSLIRRRPRVRIPLEPPIFSKRGRAANAARCKRDALTGCGGASPSASTNLFRQSVGSDVSQWYWEERSATLRAGSILCGRGETAYAPAREAGGRKPMRVQFPPPAPISRRGWNSRHGGLKPRWTLGSVPVQFRPPRSIMRPCVEQ